MTKQTTTASDGTTPPERQPKRKPEKKWTVADTLDRYQLYATHRVTLLMEELQLFKDQLAVLKETLNAALEALHRARRPGDASTIAAAQATIPRSAGDSLEEILAKAEELARDEVCLHDDARRIQVTALLRIGDAAVKTCDALASLSAERQSRAERKITGLITEAATKLQPLCDVGLLGGRHGVIEALREQTLHFLTPAQVNAAAHRAFSVGGQRRLTRAIAATATRFERTRQLSTAALDELRRLTGWMDRNAYSGDLETALVLHPALADFEDRWAVLVDLAVGEKGVEISAVVDDYYAPPFQLISIDVVRRILRRLHRMSDRYLVIDRRYPGKRLKPTIGILVDRGKSKEPLELEPGQIDEDKIIVRLCLNGRRPHMYEEAYAEICEAKAMALSTANKPSLARALAKKARAERRQRQLDGVRNRARSLARILEPKQIADRPRPRSMSSARFARANDTTPR